MIICYLAAICPQKIFKQFEKEVSVAAYQFNKLLAEGFACQDDFEVKCIVPISLLKRTNPKNLGSIVEEKNVQYILLDKRCVDEGYLRYIIETLRKIREWKKEDEVVIITDTLGIVADITAILAHMIYGIFNIGIVTDLPQYVGHLDSLKRKMVCRLNLFLMSKFQGYVLLTKPMSAWVNRRNKPQCIVEGVCDGENVIQDISVTRERKVCMYAGSLHKEYGIDMLIEAFLRANVDNSELHIYGNGNYSSEIKKLCETHKNIIYYGQRAHSEIIKKEKEVTLLINPRPTKEDYTKYSFPSKTLEYMASGTPVLMTKLAGLPFDYEEHVFLFEEETVEGYSRKIREVLNLNDLLKEKGDKAREFILSTRNKKVQAEKIISALIM